VEGRPVGVVVLGPVEGGELTGRERRLLDTLLRPIGAAVQRQQLAADLARSREALVAAREEERARLHRDLHDGLGPELATVSMLAEAAGAAVSSDPDQATALLDALVERAQAAVGDLRTLVHGLRPPALDTLGLVGAIQAYADVYTTSQTSVVVRSEAVPPLSPAVEVAAYRIAVEGLTNVARHADATSCLVRLWADGEHLHLEVQDDGCGTGGVVPGVGIRSMQERAAELGGRCEVAVHAAGGTVVRATLPAGGTTDAPPTSQVAAT
jgi:two-component system, NarL family, sensor kinase